MEFIWNDGGRAATGFVGLAGDCVTRSIAIATGLRYRAVYDELKAQASQTPRNGVSSRVAADYLASRGWAFNDGGNRPFNPDDFSKGVVIVSLVKSSGRSRHFTAVIDNVVHDTWNPAEDYYIVEAFWLPSPDSNSSAECDGLGLSVTSQTTTQDQELTQQEFDKILRRLRALDQTASNHASTDGEKRNALRMMQTLLMRHNLSRDDINPQETLDQVQFARMSCVLNGSRACNWEYSLAQYVCQHVFPLVQYYVFRRGSRSMFQFYGPRHDVFNCIQLFRELVLTIASSASLRFGGYSRGSGASYAEGYVAGLPKRDESHPPQSLADQEASQSVAESSLRLFQTRTLAVHQNANLWLKEECGICMKSTRSSGRYLDDPTARSLGKQHGASHEIKPANQPKRLH